MKILITLWFGLVLTMIAGWVTHVVTCLSDERWILLIVGAVFAPVGAIHGIGIWLGVW